MRRLIACAALLVWLISPARAADNAFYLLAISWQPAFCEGQFHKRECLTQTADRFDASHFTLHGLWPQPRSREYCGGVDPRDIRADENGRWDLLPETRLTSATWLDLQIKMPGTQSLLDRHEWIKHGTCYPGGKAETYFRDSLRLLDEINGSGVRDYFARMTGKTVRLSDIRLRFDEAFGPGAGDRIRIACKDDGQRRLITEITIGLRGNPSSEGLANLMLASRGTNGGCSRGEIDPVGLQ